MPARYAIFSAESAAAVNLSKNTCLPHVFWQVLPGKNETAHTLRALAARLVQKAGQLSHAFPAFPLPLFTLAMS